MARPARGDPEGLPDTKGGEMKRSEGAVASEPRHEEAHTSADSNGTKDATVHDLAAPRLTRDDRTALLRFMAMMRASEERGLTLYRQGKVPGSFYDGCGQEAISVGSSFALAPEDRMCILHRDLGRALRPRAYPRPLPRQLHGALRRRHRRQGRQHALRRSLARLHRHGLDASRHGARRHGHGARLQGALGEARRHDLLRRGLHRQRAVARGDEHGRRPAPADRLHPREQRLRLLDAQRARVRRRPGRARPYLRLPRRLGGRQRRRGRVRSLARCGRTRA